MHLDISTFYGNHMNKTQAKCAASFSGIGYQHKKIIINETSSIIYSLNLFSIFQGPPRYEVITVENAGLDNGTCDQLFWINFNVTNRNTSIHFPVFLDQTPGKNHSMCYRQDNGNRPLGNTTNCNQTAANGEGAPVNTSAPSGRNGLAVWTTCLLHTTTRMDGHLCPNLHFRPHLQDVSCK
ncbi:unnamed protein product [Oreochromis niloticus]|nr:unnamed protein product [Mustela putorius furo]